MSVHVQRDGHWTVIQISGDLDAGSVPQVQGQVLDTVTEPGRSYLVDLGDVPHLDSTGLAVLIKFYREVRTRGGRVALCRLQREPGASSTSPGWTPFCRSTPRSKRPGRNEGRRDAVANRQAAMMELELLVFRVGGVQLATPLERVACVLTDVTRPDGSASPGIIPYHENMVPVVPAENIFDVAVKSRPDPGAFVSSAR